MPVINRIAEFSEEIVGWRHDFHAHPELLYDVHRTAARVAELLRSFGVDEVVEGVGRTGVVGVIRGRGPGRNIGLRADMDALPILERSGKPHASTVPGTMHACGHDGHTAMLLGAAKYLAETRNFDGDAVLIFQPAEEGGAGGKAMVDDGMMERFDIAQVFGMHNMPGIPKGSFATRPGGIMAASDKFDIVIEGKGGHAARPHHAVDPVAIAAQLIVTLQTLVSRNVDPMRSAVLSVTMFHAGDAFNIIPQRVELAGTVRTLDEDVRALMETRLKEVTIGLVSTLGGRAMVNYQRGYPVTVNAAEPVEYAASAAGSVAGEERVDVNTDPSMAGEDFSYMLQARPGAFVFLGTGDGPELHSDTYDFNDEVIPVGVSYWVRLVEGTSKLA
jgi:hippurate hydrolase